MGVVLELLSCFTSSESERALHLGRLTKQPEFSLSSEFGVYSYKLLYCTGVAYAAVYECLNCVSLYKLQKERSWHLSFGQCCLPHLLAGGGFGYFVPKVSRIWIYLICVYCSGKWIDYIGMDMHAAEKASVQFVSYIPLKWILVYVCVQITI
jgi:hypothetical protein